MSGSIKLFTTEAEMEMIAGDSFDKVYEVFHEDGNAAILTLPGTKIEWSLCQYGCKLMPLVHKSSARGEIFVDPYAPNEFSVHLDSADTEDLVGLHTCQVTITDPVGIVNRTYEGSVIIRSRIVNPVT